MGDRSTASSSTRSNISRIWTEHDEALLIKALAAYTKKYGFCPISSDEIQRAASFAKEEFQKTYHHEQICNKVRKLKKKFVSMSAKPQNILKRILAKPHEKYVFKFSKMIWSPTGRGEKTTNGRVRSETTETSELRLLDNLMKDILIKEKITYDPVVEEGVKLLKNPTIQALWEKSLVFDSKCLQERLILKHMMIKELKNRLSNSWKHH